MKRVCHDRYELSLYAHISHIDWQYEETTRYKGEISNPDKCSLQHFDLDPKQMTQVEATNQLWSLMQ